MSSPVPDADAEYAFVPSRAGGGLLAFHRDARPPAGSTHTLTLSRPDGEGPTPVVAIPAWSEAFASLVRAPPSGSGSARVLSAIVSLARGIVIQGRVRPAFRELPEGVVAGWRASPGHEARKLLAEWAGAAPAAFFVRPPGEGGGRWATLAAALDACVDVLVREPGADAPGPGFEASVAAALTSAVGGDRVVATTKTSPRAARALLDWDRALRQREVSRPRLLLSVAASEGRLRLVFLAEARDADGASCGPVGLGSVLSSAPVAHVLGDDLEPVATQLRASLEAAGRVVAPIAAALAAPAPSGCALSAEEAWSLLTRHRPELESHGTRIDAPPELADLDARFPRPQVLLTRLDGLPATEPTLSATYRQTWQVVSGDVVLTPAELRVAGASAPLAWVGGRWIPVTAEAAERLAKVAERPESTWSGAQALSAALAGEVRAPGDLSDARAVVEPGLEAVVRELSAEVEVPPPPPGLQATLRGYQSRGVAWLLHRTRLGLGALLADDMGLGKTVQLIALLAHLRDRAAPGGPTLLVCPASLVGHWERELGRFAPSLKVVRHHGAERVRNDAELVERAGPHDVVVTTYGLVRRDVEWLANVPFGTVVLDEAQNAKNASTAQSKAVRQLKSMRRVALTGTPVENRLAELWTLMEFLNPGLLGTQDRFRREIALPLERDRDARAARWLRAATGPFLLRRLKTDPTLLPELPEKQVSREWCVLSEEQAKLYKEAVDASLAAIEEATGIERRGRVLKLLTDVKQVCNHPSHYLGDDGPLAGRSGKLERCREIVEELVDAGDRALVFTQYVEMGHRLVKHLSDKLGRDVPLFHGGLPLPKRDALVRAFQEDPSASPVLVLSLRAGGTGLTLTRANHVIHFDRWWNPAVEDQATDRAHRIGQTRTVQVHHLVTLGTLEERIDRMLEQKRGLAEAAVGEGEAWLTELSTDELRALVALGSNAAVESVEALD